MPVEFTRNVLAVAHAGPSVIQGPLRGILDSFVKVLNGSFVVVKLPQKFGYIAAASQPKLFFSFNLDLESGV